MCKTLIRGNICERKWKWKWTRLGEPADCCANLIPSEFLVGRQQRREGQQAASVVEVENAMKF